ncbi:flagellar basal-body rod protein FlgG [Burkholderiaceae bacterium DAT-1]|nr:flagellar basal-body rod protein FlgG [Burkholderiaceae bacterium DAT-1]
MMRALWVAKTGMDAMQLNIDVISNNLANVNTTGFKASRANFQDLIYQTMRQPGGSTTQQTQLPTGLQLGTGVMSVNAERIFTQGNPQQTNAPLDMQINGQGFFQITMPDGSTTYTRDGNFQLNNQGQVVTASGYLLNPAISLPPNVTKVTIGTDGTVSVNLPGQTNPTQVGQIQLANFINPAGLASIGNNLFQETTASGTPQVGTPGQTGLGNINQSYVEASNVNITEELVNMIQAQRAYEMNSKSIQTVDQMLQRLTQLT